MPRKVKIITYGCQMNVFDSQSVEDLLRDNFAIEPTEDVEDADVIIINTCSVREKPVQKVFSTINRLAQYKKKNPELILGVMGCVTRHASDEIMREFDFVNFVMGPDHVIEMPQIMQDVLAGKRVKAISQAKKGQYEFTGLSKNRGFRVAEFLTVIKGCNKVCSYCIVPYTRGPQQSKPVSLVVEEVRFLVDRGVKEVTLLGQNVNAYGLDLEEKVTFRHLLEEVAKIDGLKRLRFVTSHPQDADKAFLSVFADIDKVMPYLHLPLQAGSDRILEVMRRGYTLNEYLKKVDFVRECCPEVVLSTDIIVGFPSETVEDFEKTMDAVRRVGFEQMFSFMYSPRPHTTALRMKDDVPSEEKLRRLQQLQAMQEEFQQKALSKLENTVQEVLIEDLSKYAKAKGVRQWMGRTPTNWVVNVDDPEGIIRSGDIVKVKIKEAHRHSLEGELISQE